MEELEVLELGLVGIDNGVDGRVDFVFEGEDVPADLAVGVLEHACVEAAEDVWGVVLGVGGADGGLEGGSQVVPEECVGRAGEARAGYSVSGCFTRVDGILP